jgi:hypothetical protein
MGQFQFFSHSCEDRSLAKPAGQGNLARDSLLHYSLILLPYYIAQKVRVFGWFVHFFFWQAGKNIIKKTSAFFYFCGLAGLAGLALLFLRARF